MEKEEVAAVVQRVEAPGGDWARGAALRVHTSRGVLAIEPLGAAAFSQWVLGLNAALAVCQTRRKEYILACPARTIPRNSMFVIGGEQGGARARA